MIRVSRSAEDAQAEAMTAVCVACDGIGGSFRWSAAQLAGRPGYRLWSLRAVSDSNQTEAPLGDERLEAAAPVSRELFQRLFANAPVGIAVVDRFGRFIEANRAAGELFCASPQELVGGELISLLNEGERAAIAARLAAAADGEVDREPIEIPGTPARKDHRLIAQPVRCSRGRNLSFADCFRKFRCNRRPRQCRSGRPHALSDRRHRAEKS